MDISPFEVCRVDPIWQLVLVACRGGVGDSDLKEPWLAEERVGAVTWSRELYESSEQGFEDRIVFTRIAAPDEEAETTENRPLLT